jgi:hypothetical protein
MQIGPLTFIIPPSKQCLRLVLVLVVHSETFVLGHCAGKLFLGAAELLLHAIEADVEIMDSALGSSHGGPGPGPSLVGRGRRG